VCSRVQPRKVTIEKKDEINEYKKKGKDKKKSVPVPPALYLDPGCYGVRVVHICVF
jgi:hypothetical protein